MTLINGKLNKSGYDNINCNLRITLDNKTPLVESGIIHLDLPQTFPVVNGNVAANVPNTVNTNQSYHFEFVTPEDTLLYEFHAQIPSVATVDIKDLLPTGISRETLDTSARRIKQLIKEDTEIVSILQGGPYARGLYDSGAFYDKSDAVIFQGDGYVHTGNQRITGIVPPAAPWVKYVEKGETGSGTTGNDTPYNPVVYRGNKDAPTLNQITNIVETLARKTEIEFKAPLSNPIFSGIVQVPTPPFEDNSNRSITTRYAKQFLAPSNNPQFTGAVNVPTAASRHDASVLAANTYFVQQNKQIRGLVQGFTSTVVLYTTTNFVDTTLEAYITPQSVNSEIWVIVMQNGCGAFSGPNAYLDLRLLRDNQPLVHFGHPAGYTAGSIPVNAIGTCAISHISTAGTTNPIRFYTQARNMIGTGQVITNWNVSSSMTIIEILRGNINAN